MPLVINYTHEGNNESEVTITIKVKLVTMKVNLVTKKVKLHRKYFFTII